MGALTAWWPYIWGLDLREIHPRKFKSSYMFAKTYHLQREKMIYYQLSMTLCVVGESLITSGLSDYIDLQDAVSHADERAMIHNNNIVGIGSYTIFSGVAVATVFGAGLFFDLFWPERYEPKWVKCMWKWGGVFCTLCLFADCLAQTVIVARDSAYISGVDDATAADLLRRFPKPPLRYANYGRNVASCVFLWVGFVFTVVSCYYLWRGYQYIDRNGTIKSKATLEAEHEAGDLKVRGAASPDVGVHTSTGEPKLANARSLGDSLNPSSATTPSAEITEPQPPVLPPFPTVGDDSTASLPTKTGGAPLGKPVDV